MDKRQNLELIADISNANGAPDLRMMWWRRSADMQKDWENSKKTVFAILYLPQRKQRKPSGGTAGRTQ